MATHRVIHPEDTPPNPVNPSICNSFSAQLGAQVTFGGVNGNQTITQVGSIWPFTVPSPMAVPNAQTIRIRNDGTLTVGQTYPYSVSQACIEGIQKGVTIIT
jgi:hypothetical protein